MKRVGYITDKDRRRITLLEAMGDYGNVQKAYKIATLESWEQTAGYDGEELKERAKDLQLRERQDL